MKIFLYALLCSTTQTLLALNIHSIQLSQSSAQSLNVSLNTQAVELYYYDSYNYSISGNAITLNVFFIEGFGSSIAYLNNNFTIPNLHNQQYTLLVQIFYTNTAHSFRQLKDNTRLVFSLPFPNFKKDIGQCNQILKVDSYLGEIVLTQAADGAAVYDVTGRELQPAIVGNVIYLGSVANGLYILKTKPCEQRSLKIILQK